MTIVERSIDALQKDINIELKKEIVKTLIWVLFEKDAAYEEVQNVLKHIDKDLLDVACEDMAMV